MTENVKMQIFSYDEENTDTILNSKDYWDKIQKYDISESYYLYKNSAYLNLYSVPEEYRGCVAINSEKGMMVVYTYKNNKNFCNSIVEHFSDIHNIEISIYSPTYTELCSLLRSADKLTVYGHNPETSEIEDLSDKVIQGANLPVTKAKLEWNNPVKLSVRFHNQNYEIKTQEENIEEFNKTKEYRKFIDIITTNFEF